MKNCIYKIYSKSNKKFYIGSCLNPYKRKWLHFKNLKSNSHHNIKMQRHFNKYGDDDLVFQILEHSIDSSILIRIEQQYIDKLNPTFNICRVAGSKLGVRMLEETKKKISESLRGRKYSSERKKNMSKGRKGIKPKPFTKQHKLNMSYAMRGKKKTGGNRKKPVLQYQDGILINEHLSVKEASEFVGTSRGNIIMALNKKQKKAKGYEWKYKNSTLNAS